MSKFISLQALEEMDAPDLYSRWLKAEFPFDSAACGQCVTQHRNNLARCSCHEFLVDARAVLPQYASDAVEDYLEAIYSLRLFYAHLYANNPPEIMDEPAVEQVLVAKEAQ